jgi:hypothetical protein
MVKRPHTTIGLKKTTKSSLDKRRAPGQCYDGFLWQLMALWDDYKPGMKLEPGQKNRVTY